MMRSTWLIAGCGLVLGCSTSNVIADEKKPPKTTSHDDGGAGAESSEESSVTTSEEEETTSDSESRDETEPSDTKSSSEEDSETEAVPADDAGPSATLPSEPACTPSSESEAECSDGIDDDCDGYADCRDSECEGEACGSDSSLTCTAGACLTAAPGLPELPPIQNVRVTMNHDTALVEFEPIDDALDYRIYPLPDAADVLVGEDGELVVKDAIYRCAGDRPLGLREDDPAGFFDASLTMGVNVRGYERTEEEAVLGYVYTVPGPDREPVYRMADPNGAGGYAWDYVTPPSSEYNSADYVVGEEERERLIAAGYRDDGLAFYAPSKGTRKVYRRQFAPDDWGPSSAIFYTDGPEYDAHEMSSEDIIDAGERFSVLEDEADGAVPLYRVFYLSTNAFDVLAAGEARFQRALRQGNQPIWSLTWPGLKADTTLVVEALDQGCPFPGGYISHDAKPGNPDTEGFYPSITLDDARLESGEAFINGQHEPENRPRPIARAFVDVTPEPAPAMDWYEDFATDGKWAAFDDDETFNNGIFLRRNDDWVIEYSGCTESNTIGPVLGQLVFGGGDGGSSCNMSIIPRQVHPKVADDSFVHMRMTTEIPSTFRRYPQLILTTAKVLNTGDVNENEVPIRHRFGPLPFEEDYQARSGSEHTIVVQPFSSAHELQIEFCDGRGWGVSVQCPRANLAGFHVGSYEDTWEEPWVPVPVLGDLAGHDRPVRFDVYASTKRVYVTVDGKPAGCADLPEGRMPEGEVTPIFGSVIYHGGIDESVTEESSPHQYLRRYSLVHYDRKIDEMGIDMAVAAPPWDESVIPCGKRWYGAEE
jgi:hypothetical protein